MSNLSKADRSRVLSSLINNINKKHPGIILDPDNLPNLDTIGTGSYKLDALLGIGGIARGRMTELYRSIRCR